MDRPTPADTARPGAATQRAVPRRGIVGWLSFDWAQQPFYTLITTFLFAPYFTGVFYGDAVRGQATWGYATAFAGLCIALASPVIGAMADASGRLKRWIFGFSVPFVLGQLAVMLARPGDGAAVAPVLAGVIVAMIAGEFASVLSNALMPRLVPERQLGRLSGFGWAIGYLGGLVGLLVYAGFILPDAASGRTLLGFTPLIPLDTATRQAERFLGLFTAGWYCLFILPFLLFTPDAPARPGAPRPSIRQGFAALGATIARARHYGSILRFLIARSFYNDGLGAIFAFGGIYAASLFAWPTTTLGVFGVILTAAAAGGAAAGGWLDDRLGPKAVIVGSVTLLVLGMAGILAVPSSGPPAGAGLFATPREQAYLALAIGMGLVAGPLQAASRSLLARMAPPEQMTEFFGLFAFSGKATSFLVPLSIGIITDITGSARLGLAAIIAFLLLGLVVLLPVVPRRVSAVPEALSAGSDAPR